ncbi:hypothetical protein [Nocardia sp. R6R-6]|uniref:hypothetical protein n=1 Tax=Nocardia sp. R6R-6 TaxID=3459303 RepID=UPI00403E1D7F
MPSTSALPGGRVGASPSWKKSIGNSFSERVILMSSQSVLSEDAAVDDDSTETEADWNKRQQRNKHSSVVRAAINHGRNAGDSAIKLKTIAAGLLCAVMVAAIAVLGWQLHGKATDLGHVNAAAAERMHAEQVALDYATGAADMNFQDLATWRGRLVKGTTPELSNRLTQAASSMEQIIMPLQWSSTAKPIAAKVRSESNGIYQIDCFVSVLTKNSQAPRGIQSTATYSLSVDSRNAWIITDIGGIDAALGAKPGK